MCSHKDYRWVSKTYRKETTEEKKRPRNMCYVHGLVLFTTAGDSAHGAQPKAQTQRHTKEGALHPISQLQMMFLI